MSNDGRKMAQSWTLKMAKKGFRISSVVFRTDKIQIDQIVNSPNVWIFKDKIHSKTEKLS